MESPGRTTRDHPAGVDGGIGCGSMGDPGIGTSAGKSGEGASSGFGCGTSLGKGEAVELATQSEPAQAGLCKSLARYLPDPFLRQRKSNVACADSSQPRAV